MIEFNGYISGNAEKFFWKKSAILAQYIFLFSSVFCFPLAILFANAFNNKGFIIVYVLLTLMIPLIFYIPKRKKAKINYLPKRICIEEGFIICETQTQEVTRNLADIKRVEDCGDWYFIMFHFGKISCNFICQKDLLTKGSLEEFEALFNGKIVKKQIKNDNEV